MFLEELNKSESVAFVNLIKELAMVDKVFAREEKKLIKEYKEELKLSDDEIKEMDMNEIVSELQSSSKRIKLIIYFELVGLSLADGKYDEREIDFLDEIAEKFDVSRAKKIAIANYFYNFKEIYKFSVVDSKSKIDLLREDVELLLS
ncbi:MAG: TerB family tellurite resistance protein [Clostridium sp.]|uniref:hypothetical protein n=1 Tax=Clostridium sp. DSM 8431 TaxID=1761781 RepID=UPI0008E0BB2B|nr:hypothetical protein [Clostridium sp. DSM 8431]MCR4944819.1 TerB family tellurite resistance protein [Clostridium sp.]SFU67230.1 hypothetical protein SAMN04487886_10962 [Clostridium sp. DSM 8431]